MPSVGALEALAGQAEAAQVELLQLGPHLLLGGAIGLEALLGVPEGLDVLGIDAAGGVAGRGLEEDRFVAPDGRRLEAGDDGTAGHCLGGEQVGRAHQHADLGAPCRERTCHGRDHGGGTLVVDPAGKQHVQLVFVAEGQEPLDLGLPQGEAGTRADVAAAFPALEDELAGTVVQETVEQAGGGDVQEGVDSRRLERCRLRRAAAGDEGARGADVVDDRQLGFPQFGGDEAEDADAPGAALKEGRGFFEQRPNLVAAHQRQRQERQASRLGDRQGEGGPVTDPGHRSLGDGDRQAPGGRERRVGREGRGVACGRQVLGDRAADGRHHGACGRVRFRQRAGEGPVLADGQELVAQVPRPQPRGDVTGHRGRGGEGGAVATLFPAVHSLTRNREIGSGVHPVAADHDGFAAVHGTDG